MTQELNLNLILDDEDDNYDIRKFNQNFTAINEFATKIKDEAISLGEELKEGNNAHMEQMREEVRKLIKELSELDYIIGEKYAVDQESMYQYIDGFKTSETIVQEDGTITETGERGTRLLVFGENELTETFITNEGDIIKKVTTFEGDRIMEVIK